MSARNLLSKIKDNLKGLKLHQSRVPKLREVKSALRVLQKAHHPDKNLDSSADGTAFKQAMLDAEVVIQFLVEHPELVKPAEEDDEGDRDLLRFLQTGEEVKLNSGSYTVYLGTAWESLEELVASTEKFLQNTRTGDLASCVVSTQSHIVDKLDYGSVTVTFWNKPKSDGRSKMLIQGKGYETFFLWTLPEIIKEAAGNMSTDPLPAIQTVRSKPPSEEQASEKTTLQSLVQGFHRVELCLVELTSRTAALESEVAKVASSLPDQQVREELAIVTRKTSALEVAVSSLVTSLPIQQVGEELARVNSDITSLGKSLSRETNLQQKTFDEILTVTKRTQETVQSGFNSGNSGSSDTSIEMLSQINHSMKTLVQAVVSGGATLDGRQNKNPLNQAPPTPKEVKKCQIFTSSIGKDMDQKMLSERLNIETEKIMAYSIEKTDTNSEPENNLSDLLKTKVKSETEVIVIQCGSVDVTRAGNADGASLVKKAAEAMVALAEEASKKHNCDIFISQAPPRHDDVMSGQGDLSKLTDFLNTTVRSACMFLPRIHTVPQGRLSSSGKQLEARYHTDGLHLTETGAALLTRNIVETVAKVRPDLATPGPDPSLQAAGTRAALDPRQSSRGGQGSRGREEFGAWGHATRGQGGEGQLASGRRGGEGNTGTRGSLHLDTGVMLRISRGTGVDSPAIAVFTW